MNDAHNSIQVSVISEFIPEQSCASEDRYVFAYHVSIANTGIDPAKLISRHWIITDGNQKIQEVKGNGVIGEQPVIEPGHTYQYSSGAVISTPVGTMEGSYQMINEHDGTPFNAVIPIFRLASPNAVN